MRHKRIIFLVCWSIVLAALMGLLCFSLYRLYQQAEKAQKTSFTGKVLTAGHEIADSVNRVIDKELMADTALSIANKTAKHDGQHTLIVMDNGVPHAIIAETVAEYRDNLVISGTDTSYLTSDDSTKRIVIIDTVTSGHSIYTDSIIRRINSQDFLDIITKILKSYDMDIYCEFGIYNLPKNQFAIRTTRMDNDILDKEAYVFPLQTNNSEIYTHYLALYFPTERAFFLQKMLNIVLPIIGIIGLLTLLLLILIITLTQQKHNHEVTNDFINNMTHEFKTPISTISLACEAMSDESIQTDVDTRKAYISMIRDENERLQKMVTNILQLAQLKKGQLKINPEDINIHGLLNSIIRSFSLQVTNLGGQLTTHFNAETPVICGDKSHIESIFINLIENALKYCDKKPDIVVETRIEKEMLVTSISDNGIGISKKNIKHIFDEFYRITKIGNVHDNKGYGLGLNYVKKIAQLHNGDVRVTSVVGKGTTFYIYLPIKNIKK